MRKQLIKRPRNGSAVKGNGKEFITALLPARMDRAPRKIPDTVTVEATIPLWREHYFMLLEAALTKGMSFGEIIAFAVHESDAFVESHNERKRY